MRSNRKGAGEGAAGRPPTLPLLVAVALFLLARPPCARAVDRVSVEVDLFVPPLQRIEANRGVFDIPAPSVGDFEAGYIESPEPVTIRVCSNTAWVLSARSMSERRETGGEEGEPRVLLRRFDARGPLGIGSVWTEVARGNPAARGEEVRLGLRFPLDWIHSEPGRHEPRIEYRLTPAER